jgi:hypothetical protein
MPLSQAVTPPTPVAQNTDSRVLFEADWANLAGWTLNSDWRVVNGMLVNDGTRPRSYAKAPWRPDATQDYAVEAELRATNCTRTEAGSGFGVVYGEAPSQPWWVNVCSDRADAPARQNQWFTHLTIVRGGLISQYINGEPRPIQTGTITLMETPHRQRAVFQGVGLMSDAQRIEVRSFRVVVP